LRGKSSFRCALPAVAAAAAMLTQAAAGSGNADPDARPADRTAIAVFLQATAGSAGSDACAEAIAPAQPPFARTSARPLVAAHRGASKYAPENTMAAFRLAETMGADSIELDVRATRDGRLIALHDETVDRTTNGTGRAVELTYREIRRLDAGGWFSPAFEGERIPSVEEVLDHFGGKIGLILELKQPSAYPGIERSLARLLSERGLDRPERGRVVIQSFDTRSLRRVRKLLPDVPIAVLVRPRHRVTSRDLADYRRFADAVHLPRSSARKPVIRRIRSHGLSVMVWNVRSKRQVRKLLQYGADGILTDDPALFDV